MVVLLRPYLCVLAVDKRKGMRKLRYLGVALLLLLGVKGSGQITLATEGNTYSNEINVTNADGSGVASGTANTGAFDSDDINFSYAGSPTGYGSASAANFSGTKDLTSDLTITGFNKFQVNPGGGSEKNYIGLVPDNAGNYFVEFRLQTGNYVLNELEFFYIFFRDNGSGHETSVKLPQFSQDGVNYTDFTTGSGYSSNGSTGEPTNVSHTITNVYVDKNSTFFVRIPIEINTTASPDAFGDLVAFRGFEFTPTQYQLVRFDLTAPDPIVVNNESNAQFDVSLEVVHPSLAGFATENISVDVQIIGGTSQVDGGDGLDPNSFSITVNWIPGDPLKKTITIPFINDGVNEENETFILYFTSAASDPKIRTLKNVDGGRTNQAVQIIDDDSPEVNFVLANDTYTEGSGGGTRTVTFDVTLTNGYPASDNKTTTVDISISGVPGSLTATAGSVDFNYPAGINPSTVSWGPGIDGVKSVSFEISEDLLIEGDEKFTLELVPAGTNTVAIGPVSAMEIIIEDDDAMEFNFRDNGGNPFANNEFVAGNENAGTIYTLRIEVDRPHQNEDVNFAIGLDLSSNPLLVEGRDYEILVGGIVKSSVNDTLPLVIPQGATEMDIQIRILDDGLVENEEFEIFNFHYLPPYGSQGADNTHQLTVQDPEDKSIVRFSLSNVTISEPGGSQTLTITVENPNVNYPTVVDFGGVPGGLAILGTDFDLNGGVHQVSIAGTDPGHNGPAVTQTSALNVDVINDNIVEGTETADIRFVGVSSWATVDAGNSSFTVTVLDDDFSTVQFEFSGVSYLESTGTGTIRVVMDKPNVNYPTTIRIDSTNNGSGVGIATFNSDYVVPTGGGPIPFDLVFPKNTTAIDFTFTITNDGLVEGDEIFEMDITSANQGAIITTDATLSRFEATIVDDDVTNLTFTSATKTLTEPAVNTVFSSIINLTQPSATPITFDVVLFAGGNATSNVDFTIAAVQSYTYNAGTSGNKSVDFTILADALAEGTENFFIEIINVNPTNTPVGIQRQEIVILDDETLEIEFATATSSQNEFNGVDVFFDASISSGSVNGPTTVDLVQISGVAQQGLDYIIIAPASGQITFPANSSSSQTIQIRIINDQLLEGTELAVFGFANPSNGATIGNNFDTHTVTIIDDEQAGLEAFFVTNGQAINEGTSGPAFDVNLPVEISGVPEFGSVIVTFSVSLASTATQGGTDDFYFGSGTLVFNPGDPNVKNFIVKINQDAIIEGDEKAIIDISSVEWRDAGNGLLQTGSAGSTFASHTIDILDDDRAIVNFSTAAQAINEETGANAANGITLTVELDQASQTDIIVRLAPIDGLAKKGTDYEWYSAGSAVVSDFLLTIPAGQITASYTFSTTLVDAIVEGAETFDGQLFVISGPATLGATDVQTITINDNDIGEFSLVRLDTDNGATATVNEVIENLEGLGNNFKVLFSKAIENLTITVDLNVLGGTAAAGLDYNFNAQTLTFTAGQSEQFFSVSYASDGLVENNETYQLGLQNAGSGHGIDGAASSLTYTIQNRDRSIVQFDFAAATVNEAGITYTINVTIDKGHANLPTRVQLADIGGGTATAGVDYVFASPQTVVFPANSNTTQTVNVTINNDALVEGDETTRFQLSVMGANAGFSNQFDIGAIDIQELKIIEDDVQTLTLTSASAAIDEDDGAATPNPSNLTYTITADKAHQNSNVQIEVEIVENDLAVFGTDFNWLLSGTKTALVVLPAGATSVTFDITTLVDAIVEGPESYDVQIQNPTQSSLIGTPSQVSTEITDNDETTVNLNVISNGTEGQSTSATVVLDPSIAIENLTISVDLQSIAAPVGNPDATAGADFTFANQTVSFPVGTKSKTIALPLIADGIVEGDEYGALEIVNPQDANYVKLGANTLREFLISDKDSSIVQFSTATESINEGDAAFQNLTVDVVLDQAPVSGPVTVNINFSSGLATSGVDFNRITNSVNFAIGNAGPETVTFTIPGDLVVEGDEDFKITFGSITGKAKVGTTKEVDVTIVDNDVMSFEITNGTLADVNEGSNENIEFEWLMDAERGSISFDLVDLGGGLVQFSNDPVPDINHPNSKTYTYNIAGVSNGNTFQLPIQYLEDALREGDEAFGLQIQNVVDANSTANNSFNRTIKDNDISTFNFNVVDATVNEDHGIYDLKIDVDFVNVNYDISIDVADLLSGTAIFNTDYQWVAPQTLTFAAGSPNQQTVQITVVDDTDNENSETADLDLLNPVGAGNSLVQLGVKNDFELTILDNDVPVVSFQNATASFNEGNGSTDVVLTIDRAPIADVVVQFTANDLGSINQANTDVVFPAPFEVTFLAGLTTPVNLNLSLPQDVIVEGTENFRLNASIKSGNATININQMDISILDDDNAVVEFDNVSPAAASVGENAGSMVYRVSISNPLEHQNVTATMTKASGLVTLGADASYPGFPAALSLQFVPGGAMVLDANFSVNDDNLLEGDEDLEMQLAVSANASLGGTITRTKTILDNEAAEVFINNFGAGKNVTEGSSLFLEIKTSLAHQNEDMTLDVLVQGSSVATDGVDFNLLSTPVTIPSGTTGPIIVEFQTVDDNDIEGNEVYELRLANLVVANGNVVLDDNDDDNGDLVPDFRIIYEGEIIDNDIPLVEIVTSSVSVDEGNGAVQLEISLDRPHTTQTITAEFAYVVSAGGASNPSDFTENLPFEISWAPGTSGSKFLSLNIIDDALVEDPENFEVKLTNVQNGLMGANRSGIVTITDNDDIQVSFSSTFGTVNENAGIYSIDVQLDKLHEDQQTEVWVSLSPAFVAANFAATPGTDFDNSVFPFKLFFDKNGAGSATKTINIPIYDDAFVEGDEQFGITIDFASAWVDLTIEPVSTVEITDVGEQTILSFDPVSTSQNEGVGTYQFQVKIANPNINEDTEVDLNIGVSGSGNNATNAADFALQGGTGTLTFPLGSTAPKFMDVDIVDDGNSEGDEFVLFTLTNPSPWVAPITTEHELRIIDNETPIVEFVGVTGTFVEGTGTYDVIVNMNQPTTGGVVTVEVDALAGIYAVAEAKEGTGEDYELTPANATVTWNVGDFGNKTVTLNVGQDNFVEGDEFFDLDLVNLRLDGATTSSISLGANDKFSGTIEDDDRSIVDFVVAASNTNESVLNGSILVRVQDINVNYPTVIDPVLTGGLAQAAGIDFDISTAISVPPVTEGDYNGTNENGNFPLAFSIVDDAIVEGNEAHDVTLSSADYWFQLGTTIPSHNFQIVDNDISTLSFAFDEYTVNEDDGTLTVSVNIDSPNVNGPTTVEVGINYTALTNEAQEGVDYSFSPNPTLVTFAAGVATPQTLVIPITDDLVPEGEEFFTLELANNAPAPNSTIDGTLGVTKCRIIDNDVPMLSFDQVTLVEDEDNAPGDNTYLVTINVTNPPTTPLAETTVRVDLNNGLTGFSAQYPSDIKLGTSADPDSDFLVLPVLMGQTTITFSLTHKEDALIEGDETFQLAMSSAANDVVFGNQYADGTITDNDRSTVRIVGISSTVGENGGTANIDVEVDLLNANSATVVHIQDLGGVALFNVDYKFGIGHDSIVFPSGAGVSTGPILRTFQLVGVNDSLWEEDESISLGLFDPSPWADVSGAQGTIAGVVVDDEKPQINFEDVSYVYNEADPTMDAVINLTKANQNNPVSITIQLTPTTNPALSPLGPNADYTASPDGFGGYEEIITFQVGETQKILSLPILQDNTLEGREFGVATIAADARFTSSQVNTSLVLDDDEVAVVRFVQVEETEAEGNSISLGVELDRPIASDSKLTIGVDISIDPQSVAQEFLDFSPPAATPISVQFTAADNPPIKSGNWDLVDDAIVEGTERLVLKIANPTSGATIGTLDSLILNITDNDKSSVQFKQASSLVSEEAPAANHAVQVFIQNANVNDTTFVDVVLTGGTALVGTDFNYATQTIAFPPGAAGNDTLKSINIGIVNDNVPEGIETMDFALQNLLPATTVEIPVGGQNTHRVDLSDEDKPSVFFIADSVSIIEETTVFQISVGITNPNVNYPTVVDVVDTERFALDGIDYNFGAAPKTIVFPANSTLNQTFNVNIIEDTDVEGWQDADFTLVNNTPGQNVTFTNPDVRMYILDDDSSDVSFNLGAQAASEAGGSVNVQVNITNPAQHHPTTVDLVLVGGTASVGDDFTYPIAKKVTFPANDNSPQIVNIPLAMDGLVEGDETFILELQNLTQLADFTPFERDTITILDQDSTLVFFTSTFKSVEEGEVLQVSVGLVGGHVNDTTRTTLQFIPGSANSPLDLTLPANMELIWAPGDESVRLLNVPTTDDSFVENLENGFFVFSNNSSSINNNVTDTLEFEIRDNDKTIVRFKLDQYTVDETSGDTVVEVEILNPHTLNETVVDVVLVGGTADNVFDYNADATTTLTFPANSTVVQSIPVSIVNDILTEGRENILFELQNASAWVELQRPNHELIIRDDEVAEIQMVLGTSSVDEAAGTATFEVEVVAAASLNFLPVTVDVVLTGGSAVNGSDFSYTSTSLTFPAGAVGAQEVTVDITEDALIEGPENLVFELRNPSNNAEISPTRKEHELTIIDNDFSVVGFAESLYTVDEAGGSIDVMVTITNPSPTLATTVDLALLGGTATNGADYNFGGTQTITFPAGSSVSQTVTIPILEDLQLEPTEYFELKLENLSGTSVYGISPTRVEIIDNEFTQVQFVNGAQNVNEADGFTQMFVEVLYPSPTSPVEVKVGTAGGTATLGSDYQFSNTTVTFGPGETGPKMVTVTILDDNIQEGVETANFELTDAIGAVITNGQHVVNIQDDEVPNVYFVQDSVIVEENSGTGNLLVAIQNPFPTQDVEVDVLYVGGTADLGVDIDFTPITLTFQAGSLVPQNVPINVLDDLIEEDEEYIILKLSDATNGAGISNAQIKVKIKDDDGANAPTPLPEYTIAEIHGENAVGGADSAGVDCFLTGVVHGVNLSTNGLDFFMHDGTGGINVNKGIGNLGYFVTEGDEIKVRGRVEQSSGLTRFVPNAIVLLSAGNILQPALTTDVLSESYEGYLTKLECVEIVNVNEWTNAGGSFLVEVTKNGNNNFLLIDANTNVFGTARPFGKITVTGMVGQLDGTSPFLHNYFLIPRYIEDVDASLDSAFTYVQNGQSFAFSIGNSNVTSVEWDFGDGFGSSLNANPGYTYFTPGVYVVTCTTTDANGCVYVQSQEVKYDPDAILETGLHFANIFPNPFDEEFKVVLTQDLKLIEVFDVSGRLVHQIQGVEGQKEYRVKLNAYSSGVYQVVIQSKEGNTRVEQMIKK